MTGKYIKGFNLVLSIMFESGCNNNLINNNKLLIFLIKLKLCKTVSEISVLFNVHYTTISRILFDTLTVLIKILVDVHFGQVKKWSNHFPGYHYIIYCIEFKVEQLSSVEQIDYMYTRKENPAILLK